MKRFQECNWIVKLWRYRHYMYLPFKWLYYQLLGLRVYDHYDDEKYDIIKGYKLWKLLIGSAQGDMNWYYTSEEIKIELLGKVIKDDKHDN